MERPRCAFVTGVAGQDGWYLAEFLLKQGYVVHGFARVADYSTVPAGVVLQQGDVTDMSSLEAAMTLAAPSEVYNLAAQSSVVASHDQPVYTADVNGLATTRILEIVRKLGPHVRVFQASSMQMFGSSPPPFNDASPFSPFTPYGISKLYSHLICQSYRRFHHVYVSCGVLFHHESPRRPQNFLCRKVTMGAASILAGKASELRVGNLNAECDWGDARDVVVGMWKSLQQDTPGDYLFATGKTHTVKFVVEVVFGFAGLDWTKWVKADPSMARVDDLTALSVDVSPSRSRLQWHECRPLEDTLWDMFEHDCASMSVTPPLRKSNK